MPFSKSVSFYKSQVSLLFKTIFKSLLWDLISPMITQTGHWTALMFYMLFKIFYIIFSFNPWSILLAFKIAVAYQTDIFPKLSAMTLKLSYYEFRAYQRLWEVYIIFPRVHYFTLNQIKFHLLSHYQSPSLLCFAWKCLIAILNFLLTVPIQSFLLKSLL